MAVHYILQPNIVFLENYYQEVIFWIIAIENVVVAFIVVYNDFYYCLKYLKGICLTQY